MSTKDYLKQLVDFDKKYKFKPDFDDNVLTVEALREVYNVISGYCKQISRIDGFFIDLPNTVNLFRNNPDDNWDKWRDNNGRTWVKRYRDYVREISGVDLPVSLLGKIGETCARLKGNASIEWEFDFHAGIDWTPGEYAESETSCLWSEYNVGRNMANANGICAVRFYKGDRKVGRALLWLTSDGLLHVFNLYHKDSVTRESVAKMLSEFLKGDYAIINCGLESENLFINGESSTAIYDKNVIAKDKIYSYHSLSVDNVVGDNVMCAECFRIIPIKDAVLTYYGRYVGLECLHARYIKCNKCGRYFFPTHIDKDGNCIACSELYELPF